MEAILKGIIDKMPPWFFIGAGVLILIALAIFLYFVIFGTSRLTKMFSSIINRDSKIEELHDKYHELQMQCEKNDAKAHQFSTASSNIRSILETLNDIRKRTEPAHQTLSEINSLLQRCLDCLASDVKERAGGSHRCGFWVHTDQGPVLTLALASSGFPKHYIGNRQLDIHRSIAGRSLRKNQLLNIANVRADSDWELNADSRSNYTSLICVPIGGYSVITLDGHQEMGSEVELIADLYATVIDGILIEQNAAFVNLRAEFEGMEEFADETAASEDPE